MGNQTGTKHSSHLLKAGIPIKGVPLRQREILAVNLARAAKDTKAYYLQYDNHLNVCNLPTLHSVEGKLQMLEDSFALK